MKKSIISIVIPARNEERNLPEVAARLEKVTAKLKEFRFEFILIDNCSEDGTAAFGRTISARDTRWRYLRFSRNFGFETSLAAGLHYATGDALIFLPSDLQDPPEYIETMLKLWKQEQCDVVYGTVVERNDGNLLKTLGAKVAYWLIHRLSDIRIPANATDFRLISRSAIDALNTCHERNRYLRGLVHWVGFRQVSFSYRREARKRGRSSAGLIHCVNFTISALIAFSAKPLRWASLIGLVASFASIAGGVVYSAIKILTYFGVFAVITPPPGFVTQVLLILFFGGIQCLFLGIMGEYLGRISEEVKQRPRWVVEESVGLVTRAVTARTRDFFNLSAVA